MGTINFETTDLYHAFESIAKNRGHTKTYFKNLLTIIPSEIKNSTVLIDPITNKYRYDYGEDYKIGEITITGTNRYLDVTNLYDSVSLARKVLEASELNDFLNKILIKSKHSDYLFEMRPFKRLNIDKYEIKNEINGILNKRIDWRVKRNFITIDFDIKNRIVDLIDHMEGIIEDINKSIDVIEIPMTNIQKLFRSVEDKFKNRKHFFHFQGVWLNISIKQNEKELLKYFKNEIDCKKIQFCIISGWSNKAYILTRSRIQEIIIRKIFSLEKSKNIIIDESAC